MMPFRPYLALALAALFAPYAHAGEVRAAVAANFAAPMQRIAAEFEKDTRHKAILAFGATGAFQTQIANGAPFDVLVAADEATPARLEALQLSVPGTRLTYATGRLVVWSSHPGVVDGQGRVLSEGRFSHLAIASPKLAPYGAAAMEAIANLKLGRSLQPKLVQGANIAQAYQFVATGNAELGFVALSQVWHDGRLIGGSGWIVPASFHAPIRQDAMLLAPGAANPADRALMDYQKSRKAVDIIRSYGYER
jgi:molybdate transport system substrate-binding protein